jgi:cytochrome c oxidase assembly protein Cox11
MLGILQILLLKNLTNRCVTNHKNVIQIFIYYIVEVAPITFIVTPIYKFFCSKIGRNFNIFQ